MTETEMKFRNLYSEINREGAVRLMTYLEEKMDFFTAPASTRYHLNKAGGLLEHSVNVAEQLIKINELQQENKLTRESCIICGLLHDVCKANYYSVSMRNAKNEQTGQWEKVPYYTVDDQFPLGHGEKSLYIISEFLRLSAVELMAIRWHMGGFDDAVRGGSFTASNAFKKYPQAVLLHLADMYSTYMIEKE